MELEAQEKNKTTVIKLTLGSTYLQGLSRLRLARLGVRRQEVRSRRLEPRILQTTPTISFLNNQQSHYCMHLINIIHTISLYEDPLPPLRSLSLTTQDSRLTPSTNSAISPATTPGQSRLGKCVAPPKSLHENHPLPFPL
jgi:hypothetical protein